MYNNNEQILKEILDVISEIKTYDLPIEVHSLLTDLELIVETKELLIQMELNNLEK